ncbi:MAG: hypothetical protein ACE5IF_01895, partial [Candidatus Bathyarchaeia archaeon]
MIVSQRTAKIFREYGFITIDPLRNWLVSKRIPSTSQILKILQSNPLHHKVSVAPWKIDPAKWVYDPKSG